MNIFLWVLQIFLAVHTAIGAVWKFSNTAEQTMPTLKAIPHSIWLSMSILEILCSMALVVPLIYKPSRLLVPFATMFIAAEMLLFCGLQVSTGGGEVSSLIYWLIFAALCAFIAYGRLVIKPIN